MDAWLRTFIRNLYHYNRDYVDIEKAYIAKFPHVPQFLYKYREFNKNHLEALHEGNLWLSSPERFNDLLDTTATYEPDKMLTENYSAEQFSRIVDGLRNGNQPILERRLIDPIPQGEWLKKIIDEHLEKATPKEKEIATSVLEISKEFVKEYSTSHLNKIYRENIAVLSLSENIYSTQMWAHYSSNNEGFCIEYDFSELNYSDLRKRLCYPVLYRKHAPDVTRYLAKSLEKNNIFFWQYVCLQKSESWKYEREWRVVFSNGTFPANKPIIMPKPKSIILGAKASTENEEIIKKYCTKNDIKVKKIKTCISSQSLKIQNCE